MGEQLLPRSSRGRMALALLAAVTACCSALGLASSESRAQGSAAAAEAGVAHARAAGIQIDPGAAEAMEAAPIGSCYNDPTRPGCPPAYRVQAPSTGSGYGLVESSTTSGTSSPQAHTTRSASGPHAHAAQASFACFVRATSLVKSTGNARAYGSNYCTSSQVIEQELFVNLYEHWNSDGQWHLMNTGSAGPGPWNKQLNASTYYFCRDTGNRSWRDLAQGYADVNGVWQGGQNELNKTLPCVG